MLPAADYRIYQRNAQGYADIFLSGKLPETVDPNAIVSTRVCREEDNLMVVPWTEGKILNDRWEITLSVPQGGLYRIETCIGTDETAVEWRGRIQNVSHVGVGELFMLTGQSNMAGFGRDVAYDPPELGVHLYGNNGRWSLATHPLNDSIDSIYPENFESESGISPMLAFARRVKHALNVPVGLVQASLGGSPLSRWNPDETGDLTRAMFRRLDAVDRVGAVVWYQGCSDAYEAESASYLARFERTVRAWREVLGNVPVLTIQLNRRINTENIEHLDRYWGMICEAQRQAARKIPDVYIVPTKDLPCSDLIHNSAGGNVILGERLASVYLNRRYGLPGLIVPDAEEVIRMDDRHLFVRMTEGSDVLPMGDCAFGIDAEDADGLIPCTKAVAKDGGLELELSRPCAKEVRLHILWRILPPAFIPRSRHGMPILSGYGILAKAKD